MKELTQKVIKTLFAGFCCSRCKSDFSIESIKILETNRGLAHCKLICTVCEKDFGEIVLNLNPKTDKHNPLKIVEGPKPINYDDVIDAHRFLKKMK